MPTIRQLTVSSKLGFDVTPDFDLGLIARYTNIPPALYSEDYRTFPAVPAAQQSASSNTDEYYGRATAHLVSLDGGLNQTSASPTARNQTATLQPQTAESLNSANASSLSAGRDQSLECAVCAARSGGCARYDPRADSASIRIASAYAELQVATRRALVLGPQTRATTTTVALAAR